MLLVWANGGGGSCSYRVPLREPPTTAIVVVQASASAAPLHVGYAAADEGGLWKHLLPPTKAGPAAHRVTASMAGTNGTAGMNGTAGGGEEELVLSDVLFGRVWVCGGQSNMEYTVRLR